MPSLGADMEAGTLVEWLVKPGDQVHRGDVVAVVETQKGAIEIEIFESGTVEEILVPLDERVPVGTPLARLRLEGEGAEPAPRPPPSSPEATAALGAAPEGGEPKPFLPLARPGPAAPAEAELRPAAERILASPAARRIASERGLDLAALTGSGPGGAVISPDLDRAPAEEPRVAGPRARPGLDLDAMRSAIAGAMARSKREIPHYYLQHTVDMATALDWLAEANAGRTPERRLLAGALFIKAVALAAQRFPAFNGFFSTKNFEPSRAVHVGVAIAIRGGGLAAPALHDADRLSLGELMDGMRDLVQRTRAGRMRSSEIADATITVSSLGERGVEALYGVIYPPQVAIVGFGKIVQRPWVIDGAVGPRPVVTATLGADHRVSDGHAGALFLAHIDKLLQEPERL